MINGLGIIIYGIWRYVAEIHFWTEQDTWANLEFEPNSNGKLEEPWIQGS
jgi:hypothetical protein